MLVTHYAIPLADSDLDAIRQRIATIGPDFDALPGLAGKLFLLATDRPCYALYYLWHSPEALHDFLDGPKFAALVDRFGRPELVHYLTRASTLPFRPGQRLDCEDAPDDPAPDDLDLHALRSGDRLALRSRESGRFEVIYVAGAHKRVDRVTVA